MSEVRNTVKISIFVKDGIQCLHFFGIPKLSGHKGTLNFPRNLNTSLFQQVEEIMVTNGMAHNVTSVVPFVTLECLDMYSVTYNRRQLKHTK